MPRSLFITHFRTGIASSPAHIVVCLMPVFLLILMTDSAAAQSGLTAEVLIGDAVPDLGPKYADVDEAIKRFANGDAISARALLDEAKKKDPALPPTDLTLAKMYVMTGNGAAGRAALEKTAAEFPNDPEAFLIYADQAYSQGGTIEPDALYNKALQLIERFNENPKRKRTLSIRGLWGRALVAERRKQWTDMSADLQALLRIDNRHAQGNYRLGIALCMQDKFREGFAAFQAAYNEDKKLLNPMLATALMYDRLERQDKAKEAFDLALRDYPTDLNTMTNHAQWLIKTDKLPDAEKRLAAARTAHPDEVQVFALSGVAARMNGKASEAEQYFVTALGKAPAHVVVMNQLATLLIAQPNPAKQNVALQFAVMNAKLNPESPDANITLAWVYNKLGRRGEMNNALRTGLQLGTLSPDSSYLVAEMVAAQGRTEDIDAAKRILSDALAADSPGIFVQRKEAQELLRKLNAR